MNVLNQKIQILTFKSYLNDTFYVHFRSSQCFSSLFHGAHLSCICRIILKAMHLCFFCLFVFVFTVLSSSLCTVLSFYMHSFLFWLWVMQCFFGSSGYLWRRQAEMRALQRHGTHTLSNNHLHCSILRYPCGEIWLWWMSDVVVPTSKSHVWGNTGIYMMCFEVKRDVTPPYTCMHYLWSFFFPLAAVESLFILFETCLNWYFGFHFSRLLLPMRWINLLTFIVISIGLDFYFSLQMTWMLSDFPIVHVNYDSIYSLWNHNLCSVEKIRVSFSNKDTAYVYQWH